MPDLHKNLAGLRAGMLLLGGVAAVGGCATDPKPGQAPVQASVDQAATDTALVLARQIHERVLVLDAHVDVVPLGETSRYGDPDGSSKVTPAKLRQGGVDAVVLAAAVGSGPRTPEGDAQARAVADAEIAAVVEMADANDDMVMVQSVADLTRAHDQGKISLMLGLQNARILQADVDQIDNLHRVGVRVYALTHLGHNDFADSSRPVYDGHTGEYEPAAEHGGLSALGQRAIARINALGGLVDVSQLSKAATLQAVELSKSPVIASHSNVRALSDVTRNLSDEEIDAIAGAGGVIHVAAFTAYLLNFSDPQLVAAIKAIRREAGVDEQYTYPYELYWEIDDPDAQREFLTRMRTLLGPATIDLLVDHVDYLVKRVGIDHVGLSTDFNHGGGIQGFVNAGEALNVTLGLVRRGYSAEHIEKIWSGNFLRVLGQAEAHAGASD